jgi:hypothetical protein
MPIFGWKCVLELSTGASVPLKLMLQENCEDINKGQIHCLCFHYL